MDFLFCKKDGLFWFFSSRNVFHGPPEGHHGHEQTEEPQATSEELGAMEERIDDLIMEIEEKKAQLIDLYRDDPETQKAIRELADVQKKELETLQEEYLRKKQELLGKSFDQSFGQSSELLHFSEAFFKRVEDLWKRPEEFGRLRQYALQRATISDLQGGWEWMGVTHAEHYSYMTAMFLENGSKPYEYKVSEAMNRASRFRLNVGLRMLSPNVFRLRVRDDRTGEVREGTRQIRKDTSGIERIGYFTSRGTYIAIGKNVGRFSGTTIEILEVWPEADPRSQQQLKKEKEWWNREKRLEIEASTAGDPERGPDSAAGPGAIPTQEIVRTSRPQLRALNVPETVIKKRVDARNHYARLIGQLRQYGIAPEGLESSYTAAHLMRDGKAIVETFGYDFEFEKELRGKIDQQMSTLQTSESLQNIFEKMQKSQATFLIKPISEGDLFMKVSGSDLTHLQVEWLSQDQRSIPDVQDYIDKVVIQKTLDFLRSVKQLPPIVPVVKAFQGEGELQGLKFNKGYQFNLTHLPLLQKVASDPKYRQKVLQYMHERRGPSGEAIKPPYDPHEFIQAALNEGATEPTNLPPDPDREARFVEDPSFQRTYNEFIQKPEMALGTQDGIRHGRKRTHPIDGVIIHDIVSEWSAERSAEFWRHSHVSTHYSISKDGRIIQVMPDDEVAHHAAGRTKHRGEFEGWLNGKTIGIDLVNWNKRGKKGYDPYTPEQYRALARLTAHLVTKHKIPLRKIMGHRVVDNHCRVDPSDVFNWTWYQQETQRLIHAARRSGNLVALNP